MHWKCAFLKYCMSVCNHYFLSKQNNTRAWYSNMTNSTQSIMKASEVSQNKDYFHLNKQNVIELCF